MKSLVVNQDGKLEVQELDMPEITEHQALVKMLSCGICGTDATIVQRTFKGFGTENYPLVLGHEGFGEVVEVGSAVTRYKKGDRVILPFVPAPRQNGQQIGSGWGAFSEYGIVDDLDSYPADAAPETAVAQQVLPESIDPQEAPVIVTLREVLSTIRYFNIDPDETVLVYGSGPVAMAFVKLLRLSGVSDVVSVVRSAEKAELMQGFGATRGINSREEDIGTAVKGLYPDGVKYVLDAVGSKEILNEALTLLKDRGEVLCYGVPKANAMELDWSSAPYNWKLNFQQMPYKEEEAQCHDQIMEWLGQGTLSLSEFISEIVDFEEVLEAFGRYLDGQTSKKVVVNFN